MEINTTFDKIAQLINNKNYTGFGPVPELQHLASEGNIIFTVIDMSGNRFTAEVYQNPETGDIQPPLLQQIPYLIGLPPPFLQDVVVEMSLPDILRMCRTNAYLNTNIYKRDDFWRKKFIYDFGTEEGYDVRDIADWKERYKNYGKVWSFGNNNMGQLGNDSEPDINKDKPTLITGTLDSVVGISGGYGHSLLIDTLGRAWSFGLNQHGQLGLGDNGLDKDRNKPTLITGTFDGVVGISGGRSHSLLLDTLGRVWSFGYNREGQLGLGYSGRKTTRNKPTLITGTLGGVVGISAGGWHSLLLDTGGRVWSSGYNAHGQLGLGDNGLGKNKNKPTLITDTFDGVKSISAGGKHSLLLDTLGRVWTFGQNEYGQLGLGDSGEGTDRNKPTLITDTLDGVVVKAISGGGEHSLLLDTFGRVWTFGSNEHGQLGLGDSGPDTNRDRPTLITGTLDGVVGIFAGWEHSLLLDTLGRVWSFGNNDSGQLGLGGSGVDINKPTLITGTLDVVGISGGRYHSLLISR